MLVDLLSDDEGFIPLEVEYRPASAGMPMEYEIIKSHPELSSPLLRVAVERGVRLARRLQLTYIAHHL